MVYHCIDEATRWSSGGILKEKTAVSSTESLTTYWLRPYGPMRLFIADQEAGLSGEEAAQWLDRWSIQLKSKEPGSHAQMVERHHELFRKLVRRVKT